MTSQLAATPLAAHAHTIAYGISTGGAAQAIASSPPRLRSLVAGAARAGFVSGLNEILLVGAVVAFVGAVVSFAFVRERDFVSAPEGEAVTAIAA